MRRARRPSCAEDARLSFFKRFCRRETATNPTTHSVGVAGRRSRGDRAAGERLGPLLLLLLLLRPRNRRGARGGDQRRRRGLHRREVYSEASEAKERKKREKSKKKKLSFENATAKAFAVALSPAHFPPSKLPFPFFILQKPQQSCPQSRCVSSSSSCFSLMPLRELLGFSSRRGRRRRGGSCSAPSRRAGTNASFENEKTIASLSFVAISFLQTPRARPPFRPDPPPHSSSNPAEARPKQLYLFLNGLDSSECTRKGAGSEGEKRLPGAIEPFVPGADIEDKVASIEVFPLAFRPPRSALLFSFRVTGRERQHRSCDGGVVARGLLASSVASSSSFCLVACFSSNERRQGEGKKKKKLARSRLDSTPPPFSASLSSHLSLPLFTFEMETKKTTTPPKQPPRFLLFGGTGWIGGLVSELLTKEGATWKASKARLEDRALILKEIEEVRRR